MTTHKQKIIRRKTMSQLCYWRKDYDYCFLIVFCAVLSRLDGHVA